MPGIYELQTEVFVDWEMDSFILPINLVALARQIL